MTEGGNSPTEFLLIKVDPAGPDLPIRFQSGDSEHSTGDGTSGVPLKSDGPSTTYLDFALVQARNSQDLNDLWAFNQSQRDDQAKLERLQG